MSTNKTIKEYENAIKSMAKIMGVDTANSANNKAFAYNMISFEIFNAGKKIIDEFLNSEDKE